MPFILSNYKQQIICLKKGGCDDNKIEWMIKSKKTHLDLKIVDEHKKI